MQKRPWERLEDYIEEGDIFDFDCFVVTVKTEGLLYGDISYQFHRKYNDFVIPDVVYGTSKGPFALPDGKKVIFTALWKKAEIGHGYSPDVVSGCTGRAIRIAGSDPKIKEIALPLIGGGEKQRMKPHMEEGLNQGLDAIHRKTKAEPNIDITVCIKPRKHRKHP